MDLLNGFWKCFFFFKPQTRLTSTLKIRDTYRKKSERKSWYNLQEFNCSGQLTVGAYTLNKTLMEHFQAWPCPKILRCGSASTFFAQICAQTAECLEFWVIDLPAHRHRQNDRFMNEQKVLSHVLLHLRGTDATGRQTLASRFTRLI